MNMKLGGISHLMQKKWVVSLIPLMKLKLSQITGFVTHSIERTKTCKNFIENIHSYVLGMITNLQITPMPQALKIITKVRVTGRRAAAPRRKHIWNGCPYAYQRQVFLPFVHLNLENLQRWQCLILE